MKSRLTRKPLPLVNAAGKPLLPLDQIVKKWAGVFEDEFWEEVRNARKPVIRRMTPKEQK